ncbi:hypothetical protein SLEP1_g48407 [Rubroshorea leprosula]|uniref:Uncharacterized protein n=1 Tax=Rubroshorea leprosula TaxID=152421 RepID=A0AAV5LTI3_9ROSI|nr:hypothetical protein SLEP1_g48407 [Rubroshorea leprosula]
MERERARVRDRFPTYRDSGSGFRRRLPGYGKHFIGQATTYSFYDFLANHFAKDFWYSFWSFGKVADVYILERRDRRGHHFGFVQMSEVSNTKDMERKLNQIWLDSYRLKVKLVENMKSGREGMSRGRQQKQTTAQWIRRDRKVSPGIAYAQIVAGKIKASDEGESMNHILEQVAVQKVPEKKVDGLEKKGAMSKESAVLPVSIPDQASTSTANDAIAKTYVPKESHPKLVLQFSPREDEVAWLSQSRVALVRSLDLVMKIQNRLDVDGLLVNVALLASRHVLLMDNTEGCLKEFIDKNEELVESWFEWIQPTSLSIMPSRNRLVWLRFNGVPLRAWSERCFLELAGLIGEVILVDDDTKSKSFLCEGRVLVLCDDTMKISQIITLMVDGESFLIKVSEEEWRMDPDWWLAGERRSSGMSLDVSNMESDNSNDRYNEGDDRAIMAEDCAETKAESKLSLKQNFVQNFELSGLEMDRLGNVGLVGPRDCEAEELEIGGHLCSGWGSGGNEGDGDAVGDGKNQISNWSWMRYESCLGWGKDWGFNVRIMRKRGLGNGLKRREILKLVKKENPDFLFLQETKLEEVEESLCRALWNLDNFDWVMQKSMGNSGGLLCIWNKSCFIKQCVIERSGFIGVSGEWGKERKKCNVINVYAPCDRQRKVLLREEIVGRVLEEGGCWLLASDFNAVRNVSERKGKMRETQDMQDFNHFVESTSLLAMDWVQEGVTRSVSDHCAIILKARNTYWGPKPFRVMDAWQQHPDFRSFVDDKWKALQVEGWAAYKCKQKLKLMKDECKRWNKEVFSNVETRWGILSKEIEVLDIKSEEIELDENEVLLRRECFQEMWEILRKREAMWKQKSSNNWICLGDVNIAFFHRCVHAWRAQNAISGILGKDGWLEEPIRVKEEAVRWRKWIHECLSTTHMSILINGSPTKEFSVGKGLHQGDPLSPFLFLLVGEGLCVVRKAKAEGLFRGVKIGDGGMVVSLLQFADDTIFMGKAEAENLRTVKAILHWFELISGLKINFCKSHLYGFNVTEGWLNGVVDILHCKIGTMPFIYLGLPVGGKSFGFLCWTIFGISLPPGNVHYCPLEVKLPCSTRLGDGVRGLWKRVIWEKYYGGRKEVDFTSFSSLHMSRVWKDIVGVGSGSERLGLMLGKGFKWEIGDGSRVAFWDDKWVGDKPLKDLFPRLYALSLTKEGLLKDMDFWSEGTWVWDCRWRRSCSGRVGEEEERFREIINRIKVKENKDDSWRWAHSADGVYFVKDAYVFLTPKDYLLAEKWVRIIWCKFAPSKVSVFGWRLFLDRLATKDNLFKRGIALLGGDVSCGLCGEGVEQGVLSKDIFGLAKFVTHGVWNKVDV